MGHTIGRCRSEEELRRLDIGHALARKKIEFNMKRDRHVGVVHDVVTARGPSCARRRRPCARAEFAAIFLCRMDVNTP